YTLLLTIALVVMVIFLFLRSLRATIIPSVAVPLSIVGTFAVMYLLGATLKTAIRLCRRPCVARNKLVSPLFHSLSPSLLFLFLFCSWETLLAGSSANSLLLWRSPFSFQRWYR